MSVPAGVWSAAGRARLAASLTTVRAALAIAALALPMTAAPQLDDAIVLTGGIALFASDLVVAFAVLAWLASRTLAPVPLRPGTLASPMLGWPLLLLFAAFLPGILRGHERYGASIVGQPLRLVLYAAIAAALVDLRPRDVYRGIVVVFYAGAAWQAVLATYYLATGTTQTPISSLSTGGNRTLALYVAMYLAGALILALLNLDLDQAPHRHWLHLAVVLVSTFGIVLSFGRTTFVSLAVVLPVLVWKLPRMRSSLRRFWRISLPLLAVGIAAVAVTVPDLGPTLVDRVTANPITDRSVRWRIRGIGAVLNAMRGREAPAVADPYSPGVPNRLPNGGFESGKAGWTFLGANASIIPSNNPNFGAWTLALTAREGEGMVSERFGAAPGQVWSFAVWLLARERGTHVTLVLEGYDSAGRPVERGALPIDLSIVPERFVVNLSLTDPEVRSVAAVIESRDPETARFLADAGRLEIVTHDGRQNFIADGTFESGTEGWRMQGGRLSTSNERAVHAEHSLVFTTAGMSGDEGPYSDLVLAQVAEAWSFSVWLSGGRDGERVNLGLWEYDGRQAGLGQTNFPVTLTTTPTRYTVTRVVANGSATYLRALIRTRGETAITVYADAALLERAEPLMPFAPQGDRGEALVPDARSTGPIQLDELFLGPGWGRMITYLFDGRVYRIGGDPDNSYVYILGGGGVLALGAFLLLLGIYLRDAWRRVRLAPGYERALVLWALATWTVFMVNCFMAPFLPRPKLVLTIWALMLLPALVQPARTRLAGEGANVDDIPGLRGSDRGDDEGETADVVPSARFGLPSLPDGRGKLRQRARALLRRDRDEGDRPGKGTPSEPAP